MSGDQVLGALALVAGLATAVRLLRRAARRRRRDATTAPWATPARRPRLPALAELAIAGVECPTHGLSIVDAADVAVRVTPTGYLQAAACPACGAEVVTQIRDGQAAELISGGARPELTERSPDPPYLGGP